MQVQRIPGSGNYNTSFAANLIINGFCSRHDELQKYAQDIGSEDDTITIDISSPERSDDSWSEMGHRYHVTETSQDIYVKWVIGGEEMERRNIGYYTRRDVYTPDEAAKCIINYLMKLKQEVNTFDTNVVGQKYISENTIQFYNRKGDIVSEVTLLDNESVEIKKTLENKSEATIEDTPEQTIIRQRKRSDNKDVDITLYKGELEGQMLITVDGHKIKINRRDYHKVIEADPELKQVIDEQNKLKDWVYDDYIGDYDVSKYIYDKNIINARAKKLFEKGDDAWKNCNFFATDWPTEFKYYIPKQNNKKHAG